MLRLVVGVVLLSLTAMNTVAQEGATGVLVFVEGSTVSSFSGSGGTRSLSGIAPSKQESTTYEPSLVCKLLILGCRLLIPDRLLGEVIWAAQQSLKPSRL